MADKIFITELPELETLSDDLAFVTDNGTQSNSVKLNTLLNYIRESFLLDNLPIVVGNTEPAYTKVLWFNTAPASSGQSIATLNLTNEATNYSVEVDGTEYPVSNMSESGDDGYSYEIV